MEGHRPVLLRECIESLNIRPDGIYVDGTLGLGGHAAAVAVLLSTGHVIAIDRDAASLFRAREFLAPLGDRVSYVHGNFRDLGRILDEQGVALADGMLFDLGVSSPQLDEAERGFSYMVDAPLDMRMDLSEKLSAWLIVNRWPEEKLRRIFWDFGEERYAPQIAAAIVRQREKGEIDGTLELVEIIKSAMPASALREKQHPAKRSFQALRIAVNDELGAIAEMLDTAFDRLKPGGRLAVISFHSLEDRLVKSAITRRENGCTCPRDFPVCVCGFKPTARGVTKKPIVPSPEEQEENPRARSAKLRVAEKL